MDASVDAPFTDKALGEGARRTADRQGRQGRETRSSFALDVAQRMASRPGQKVRFARGRARKNGKWAGGDKAVLQEICAFQQDFV